MRRLASWLYLLPLLLAGVLAQGSDNVQVTLALKDGKATYRMGDPIVLDLSFTANEPGHLINSRPEVTASSIDEITILPTDGAFPWLANASPRQSGPDDVIYREELSPGAPWHILLPVNAAYRLDKPGHYTVRVTTNRLQFPFPPTQEDNTAENTTPVTTNEVSFDLEAMSEADEQAIVDKLVSELRAFSEKFEPILNAVGTGNTEALKGDWQQVLSQGLGAYGSDLMNELNWLSGDPSTRAKVDIYLHPDVFGYYLSPRVGQGLWIAKNRRLVVSLLEQAMKDPSVDPHWNITSLTSQLKATLTEQSPNQTEQVRQEAELENLRQIAKTLPERTGTNLTETATILFEELTQAKQTETPEYIAARDVLIAHYDEVSWRVDVLLNPMDPRLVPKLEAFLREHHQPQYLSPERDAVFEELLLLAPPEDLKPFVVDAACDPESRMRFAVLTKLPVESLPEADQCLLKQIQQLSASKEGSALFELTEKTTLAGRFASRAIYQPMLAIYKQYGSKWIGNVRGAMLAYLARYDEKGGLELLKQGLKPDDDMYLCQTFYSPTVNHFFEQELQREDDPTVVAEAAEVLSGSGPAEDQAVIRARLDRWRKEWAAQGEKLDPKQASLQAELILTVISGKNWQVDETEANRLKESCVSDDCRDNIRRLAGTAP
jgi:hypothetical protein